jgi:hypothetical protein
MAIDRRAELRRTESGGVLDAMKVFYSDSGSTAIALEAVLPVLAAARSTFEGALPALLPWQFVKAGDVAGSNSLQPPGRYEACTQRDTRCFNAQMRWLSPERRSATRPGPRTLSPRAEGRSFSIVIASQQNPPLQLSRARCLSRAGRRGRGIDARDHGMTMHGRLDGAVGGSCGGDERGAAAAAPAAATRPARRSIWDC